MPPPNSRSDVPTEPLRADHRKIRELLHEYDDLPPDAGERREWLFRQIERLLILHFALEEEILYPAVQRTGTARAVESVEEARWGHRLLRQDLTELEETDPQDPEFGSRMDVLRSNLEQYATLEERSLFAEVRRMSREMRESLRAQLEQLREKLLDREPLGRRRWVRSAMRGSPRPAVTPRPRRRDLGGDSEGEREGNP